MAIDFPTTPIIGDEYTSGSLVYVWNGQGWLLKQTVDDGGAHFVGDSPPPDPVQGDLWLESDTMIFWVWYDDGNSAQWVQVSGGSSTPEGGPVDTYTKEEADARFEPLDAPYTKAESDALYEPIDTAYTKAESDSIFVNAAGDTMTGGLNTVGIVNNGAFSSSAMASLNGGVNISYSFDSYVHLALHNTGVIMDAPVNTQPSQIIGKKAGVTHWTIVMGDAAVQGGGNTGSNFQLIHHDDSGGGIGGNGICLSIERSSGVVTMPNIVQFGFGPYSAQTTPIRVGFSGGGLQYGMTLRQGVDFANVILFQNSADQTMGIISSTATTVNYGTSSDERLKEDLQTFDSGPIIDGTQVYNFAWKLDGTRNYGVVAQQAVEVYPQAVTYTEGLDHWEVDYSKYVPVLLQELKMLRARVAQLEAAARK